MLGQWHKRLKNASKACKNFLCGYLLFVTSDAFPEIASRGFENLHIGVTKVDMSSKWNVKYPFVRPFCSC